MSTGTKTCRALALAGYFLLLALLLARYTWIAPPQRVPLAVTLLVIVAPLLLPLRGLLRARAYTHAWTSFLALPYFVLGVDALAAGAGPAWLAWATLTASLGLFAGAVGYARLRGRELQAAAAGDA